MQVKVQALRQGYYGHRRIKEGSVFFMKEDGLMLKNKVKNEEKLKELDSSGRIYKVGKTDYVLPSWVKLAQSAKVELPEVEVESLAESPKVNDEVI